MRLPRLPALLLLTGLVACAPACREPASEMARLELLFGADRANGSPIGDAEWSRFLDSEVTPRFPDGLTVIDGAGQWRGGGAVLRERTRMLLIWYRPTPRSEADIEAIRAAYKERFGQDSVLRADGVSCVSF